MVRTRHSLPTKPTTPPPETSTTPQAPATEHPQPAKNKRLSNALKKLLVDGTAALVGGERPQLPSSERSEEQVYHYRGAVYAVTDATKREWVEEQPKRYKKRTSGVGGEAVEKDAGKAGEEARREEENVVMDRAEDAMMSSASKKRNRASFELDGAADEDEEEEGTDTSPNKRAKRNVPQKYYGRPRRRRTNNSSTTSTIKPRKRRYAIQDDDRTPMDDARRQDYTIVGGHEEQSCIDAARATAISKGYAVEPLPDPPRREIEREDLAVLVGTDVLKIARINSKILKLREEYDFAKEMLEGLREGTGVQATTEMRDVEDTIINDALAGPSRLRIDVPETATATLRDGMQEPTPPSQVSQEDDASEASSPNSDVEIITDRQLFPRHDSATSITPPTQAARRKRPKNHERIETQPVRLRQESISISAERLSSLTLPSANKGGNILRWSLGQNLQNEERAEAQIRFSRMAGESKSARRRRVKRELKICRGWSPVHEGGEGRSVVVE